MEISETNNQRRRNVLQMSLDRATILHIFIRAVRDTMPSAGETTHLFHLKSTFYSYRSRTKDLSAGEYLGVGVIAPSRSKCPPLYARDSTERRHRLYHLLAYLKNISK